MENADPHMIRQILKSLWERIKRPIGTFVQMYNFLILISNVLFIVKKLFITFTKSGSGKGKDFLFKMITNEENRDIHTPIHREMFDLHKSNTDNETTFKTVTPKIFGYSMATNAAASSLVDLTYYLEIQKIEGAFVELGCWKGGMSALMAMCSENREIWLFDSFVGLPQLTPNDFIGDFSKEMKTEEDSGRLTPIGALEASIEDAKTAMFDIAKHPKEKTHFIKGWFQDTLPSEVKNIGEIALLRLDGDLYESYMISLDYLWDKVVPGGFIIIDDWALAGCRKAVQDFFAKNNIKQPYLHNIDFTVRVIQKP